MGPKSVSRRSATDRICCIARSDCGAKIDLSFACGIPGAATIRIHHLFRDFIIIGLASGMSGTRRLKPTYSPRGIRAASRDYHSRRTQTACREPIICHRITPQCQSKPTCSIYRTSPSGAAYVIPSLLMPSENWRPQNHRPRSDPHWGMQGCSTRHQAKRSRTERPDIALAYRHRGLAHKEPITGVCLSRCWSRSVGSGS